MIGQQSCTELCPALALLGSRTPITKFKIFSMHCSPYCTDICQAKLSLTEKGVKEQSAWDKKKKDQSKETQHKLVNLTDNEGIKKEETKIIF